MHTRLTLQLGVPNTEFHLCCITEAQAQALTFGNGQAFASAMASVQVVNDCYHGSATTDAIASTTANANAGTNAADIANAQANAQATSAANTQTTSGQTRDHKVSIFRTFQFGIC